MHLGHSRHLLLSIVAGFAASFIVLLASVSMQQSGMRGQLVAGDPNLNRGLPSTYNTMQGIVDGSNSTIGAMSSYGFWVMVLIGGCIASVVAFKMLRRYV